MNVALASLAGIALFVWPFLGLGVAPEVPALALTLGVVAMLVLLEAGARRLDSGRLALLAALAAMDAALRLAMVNGVGGFSPIFFLVLVAGYEFGASYGFLVGAFSLLVSALVTGGVGPWLPYETFAVGWTGVAAGLTGSFVRRFGPRRTGWLPTRLDVAVLVIVGVVTGFAYGAVTDIWGWVAFYRGIENIGWSPDLSAGAALANFARYYAVTSLVWDSFRAAGNAIAILVFGPPVMAALVRLRSRLGYVIEASPPESNRRASASQSASIP